MTARHALPTHAAPASPTAPAGVQASGAHRVVLRNGGRHVAPARWRILLPILWRVCVAMTLLAAAGGAAAIGWLEVAEGRWHSLYTATFAAAGLVAASVVVIQRARADLGG